MKVMIALNTTWNLVNFRGGLIKALQDKGHDVLAIAPPDSYVDKLKTLGCEYISIEMDNKGTNILNDLRLCWQFFKILKKYQPNLILAYTIKPNIYLSLIAHVFGISVINTVTGLGTAYIKENFVTKLINVLYKLAFSRSKKVFFQNADDLSLFLSKKIVNERNIDRIPGSGVDLKKFKPQVKERSSNHVFQFLFIGRVIADKGIFEFYEAVQVLKAKGYSFHARVLGFLEVENVGAVTYAQMNQWVTAGHLEYLGTADDIRPYMHDADCIVLPSYREGISKALLEACAMAKPIVTTDVAGCRELVDDGINGYLCEIKNVTDLAIKMEKMLMKNFVELDAMGMKGRNKIEKEYDEEIVIKQYLQELDQIS